MTILDLIKKSAIMLNIKPVLEDVNLNDITSTTEVETLSNNFELKRLFEFSKVVLNEIATYSPIVDQIQSVSSNKKIPLSNINNLLKVIAVKDEFGYVDYTINDNEINIAKDGMYTIVFNRSSQINSLLGNIDMRNGDISEDLLVCGLNSYYCLATGLFAEYNVYNSSYVDKLSRIKNLKLFAMPCRSWNG